jgi:hypothetical protein
LVGGAIQMLAPSLTRQVFDPRSLTPLNRPEDCTSHPKKDVYVSNSEHEIQLQLLHNPVTLISILQLEGTCRRIIPRRSYLDRPSLTSGSS